MKKILIIEDEPTLRDEIGEILKLEGYNVLLAENGKVGLIKTLNNMPDVILCDIMMPVMNGTEVLTKLRSDKNTRMIQFVFMTALADRKDLRTGMELGADDYLTKPFTRIELLNTISTRLEKINVIEEKLEEDMDQLKHSIISYMPHELRSPLNGIIGLGSFLEENAGTLEAKEIKEMGRMIYESGDLLLSTISKYLIYIKLTTTPPLFSSFVELKGTAELVSTIVKESANNFFRLSELVMNIEEITLIASIDTFSILIKELTDNAFKFSDQGTNVTVSFLKKNGMAEFSVHNYGRVFPEGSIEKIGAFVQFDRQKYEQQGSGFGLVISKKIIDLLKGAISIDSSSENGTTITVTFPLSAL